MMMMTTRMTTMTVMMMVMVMMYLSSVVKPLEIRFNNIIIIDIIILYKSITIIKQLHVYWFMW